MKKFALLIILATLLIAGCSNSNSEETATSILDQDWQQIEEAAKGTEVHIFMWGGDDGVNSYIDDWVAPRLKDNYDIKLVRHPMDAADFISKLMTEKKADKTKGTIDIIWINGENFRNAKENGLLLGSFATKLPNLQNYIGEDKAYVTNDMGTAIEGLEAPWGKVQFVLNYDSAKVQNPPTTFTELLQWVQENPGQFTYPNVNDFTGNAFVRQLLYDVATNDPTAIQNSYNEQWLTENSGRIWSVLNNLEASLWREGKTYPESLAQLDQLYSKGEVAFTMAFNERRVSSLIEDGVFPETTKSLVLQPGSIGNSHYLSVPFNSPNAAGAITAINFFLSPEAQIAKMDESMWGEGTVLDASKLSDEQRAQLEELSGPSVVNPDEILPELNAAYADWIKEHWENEVVQK
ncbi:ABC transporter substrate-binding protein [Bacillus sp. HMF5848]|uniref:ABC transporter substrate-binding protein n=1 Tax=Bacillus sp. HMF5848 TaxID=2495421 RepID=UPI000F7A115C|nr:ABC transporter substrate-binding protein [Bacillus sp. HMF5848]RSK29068.1 ABC transporter substrate-binding protein [Bacillus sp. HMF5848]